MRRYELLLIPLILAGCRWQWGSAGRDGAAAPVTAATAIAPAPATAGARPEGTLGADGPVAPTPAEATLAPTPGPIAGDAVLAACNPAEQAAAMRPDQVVDWQALGLSACYDLTLEIEPGARRYVGTLDLTYTNRTTDSLPALLFRTYPNADVIYGGALTVTAANIEGKPAAGEVVLADRTGYRLRLPAPLGPGESIHARLQFEGAIPADFAAGDSVYGVFNVDTASGTVMLANAFPLLAVFRPGLGYREPEVVSEGDAVTSEAALFRLMLIVPEEYRVMTSGVPVGEVAEGGRIGHRIVTGPVRDLAIVLSPAMESSAVTVDGARIQSHYLPEAGSAGQDVADLTARAVRLFDDRFGPYPLAELDAVQVPLRNALGVEYPGLFVVEAETYTNPEQRPAFEVSTVHEAAHQWWYNVVGNDVYSDPWQDEALTSWSSLYFFEEERPEFARGLKRSWERTLDRFREEHEDEPIAQPLGRFAGRSEAYGVIVYVKGALFFDALRRELGDVAFFDALQRYYQANRYGIAAPEELLGTFEKTSGRGLSEFYARWGVEP